MMKMRQLLVATVVLAALAATLYWSNHRKPASDSVTASAERDKRQGYFPDSGRYFQAGSKEKGRRRRRSQPRRPVELENHFAETPGRRSGLGFDDSLQFVADGWRDAHRGKARRPEAIRPGGARGPGIRHRKRRKDAYHPGRRRDAHGRFRLRHAFRRIQSVFGSQEYKNEFGQGPERPARQAPACLSISTSWPAWKSTARNCI